MPRVGDTEEQSCGGSAGWCLLGLRPDQSLRSGRDLTSAGRAEIARHGFRPGPKSVSKRKPRWAPVGREKKVGRSLQRVLVPASPAPAATTTTAATKSTAAAWGLFSRLVDRQRPAAEFPPVQRTDGRLGLCLTPHLDEGKTARSARVPIGDDLDVGNLASAFLEQGAELCLVRVKRQIPNVQPGPHDPQPPSPRNCGAISLSGARCLLLGSWVRPCHAQSEASSPRYLFDPFSPRQGSG